MDFIEMIKDAGVVGAGGAGFPTHVKLNAKAEIFLINAAECEPLIETDQYLCRTFAASIVAGAMAISAHLGASRTIIALKAKYTREIKALEEAITQSGAAMELFQMDTFYPAGDEQIMVRHVTGRSVSERGLPLDAGVVVDNVGTVLNVYHAMQGEPVTHKFLSVTGEVPEPIMLRAPIGTSVKECVEAAAPNCSDYALILGGPMMGRKLWEPEEIEEAVVTKTTGNLLVLPRDHYLIKREQTPMSSIRAQSKSACIQCRMCTDFCPRYQNGHRMRSHLIMRSLYQEPILTQGDEFLRAFGEAVNCCGCGVCEMFACPMGLSPRKVNEYMKGQLRTRGLMPDRLLDPKPRKEADLYQVPTGRLAARLGLSQFWGMHASDDCKDVTPDSVFLPFQQHIGKPAVPVKSLGDEILCGQLLAKGAEDGLSANIYASLTGVISEINQTGVRIRKKEA